jgi:hypothetical protein
LSISARSQNKNSEQAILRLPSADAASALAGGCDTRRVLIAMRLLIGLDGHARALSTCKVAHSLRCLGCDGNQ